MESRQLGALGAAIAICILLSILQTTLFQPELGQGILNVPASPGPGASNYHESSSIPVEPSTVLDSSPPFNGNAELSEVLNIQDPIDRERALVAMCGRWVKLNPEEALQTASRLEAGELRVQVTRVLTHDWAREEPDRAAQWALDLPEGSERNRMIDFVFSKIAETEPQQALRLVQNAKVQPGLIGNLVQQWAAEDFHAALNWVNALPPGDSRQESFRRIALIWSKNDPMKAADLVADQIAPGPEQTEAAVSVIHQWALRDLRGARAWAEQFPRGALRERVLAEVAGMEQAR